MRAEISVAPRNALKAIPSIYHANFARVLEMPSSDFLDYLQDAASRNPCIEVDGSTVSYTFVEGRLRRLDTSTGRYSSRPSPIQPEVSGAFEDFTESLPFFLSTYLHEVLDAEILEELVDSLDPRGFLDDSYEAIAERAGRTIREVEVAVEVLKSVPPGGIGSRDLQEFLLFQCEQIGRVTPCMKRLIEEMLPDVAKGNVSRIQRKLGVCQARMSELIGVLKGLRPYPTWGSGLASGTDREEILRQPPDFIFEKAQDGSYVLQILEPTIRLDPLSCGNVEVSRHDDWGTSLALLREEAGSVVEICNRRRTAILAALAQILDVQHEWLLGRRDYLEPLSVSEIACAAGVPASTISRALRDRYLACPRGTFALKQLLSRRIQTTSSGNASRDFIYGEIRRLEEEQKGRGASDEQITRLLKDRGIDIARRTVNKYRKQMRGF